MAKFDRLPAIPIITHDPYFSLWMPADKLTEGQSVHWTGAPKWMAGMAKIDGKQYRYFSGRNGKKMETKELTVTPTRTVSVTEAAGVQVKVVFTSPLLLDDMDIMSTPITFIDYEIKSTDGKEHDVQLTFFAPATLCYDGENYREVEYKAFSEDGLNFMRMGRKEQNPLNHSADNITIDWGYCYLASRGGVLGTREEDSTRRVGIDFTTDLKVGPDPVKTGLMIGYDDIYSINYFGYLAKAWYARDGKTLAKAFKEFDVRHDELISRCERFDAELMAEAAERGGEDYRLIAAAGYRQTIAAHKLIADKDGNMIFLSKENDSNGCLGTVDVSYPSIPLFLKYAPNLVNAMCRPIFRLIQTPLWIYDYAPHDVGRYPYATGQVYASKRQFPNGVIIPDFYKMPADADVYTEDMQMPVEESGNMLIMLETAVTYGADDTILKENPDVLGGWVKYLDKYGEDPGDQLCTDDFAGHLARNINLSAKAFIGVECYSRILKRYGRMDEADRWHVRAKELADSWLRRATKPGGGSYLTFDKVGWSMKYNLIWDKILGLGLIPAEFYDAETKSYLQYINEFGLPLDSREDYTKSDWTVWAATLADDQEVFKKIIAPLAKYLRETKSRVPFSDWYDTKDGRCVAFIARSVQGGLYIALI